MVCPKCKSNNVKVQLRSGGTSSRSSYYKTRTKKSWIIPSSRRTYESNRKQKSYAICQNCGYHWVVGESFKDKLTGIVTLVIIILIARSCGAKKAASVTEAATPTETAVETVATEASASENSEELNDFIYD